MRFPARLGIVLGLTLGSVPPPAVALVQEGQEGDPEAAAWNYSAELSLLFTSGNSTVRTFGLGGTARREWAGGEISFRAGGLRTESGTTRRVAVGTEEDFTVTSDADPKPTAENYFLRGEYERSFSDHVHLTTGAAWERNTFAGFESRLSLVGGIGNLWVETETTRLKSDYGITFTAQNDVVDDPEKSSGFGGVRVSTDFRRRLTPTASLESVLILDENLTDAADLRADFATSLAVDINSSLAVKTGLRLVWDNVPALTRAPLERPAGTPTGTTVLVPRHKLDSTLTIALVANF
ncbi:MAG: DUF481 domain-containing protein [Gemmatimonadota bacterium]|uniref:DUF481 domain-containing protein n=1 Tax=Candidatus Palauibacter scopulicola TaxID=3056741 RepID=UPI0023A3CD9E|nr:DUF481 domain-containing protein [Candidatus Palauibacter scopulicola]MDE2661729.1 DUF481 domain-containing protein [Candidatus Palauibacter scopulicola]